MLIVVTYDNFTIDHAYGVTLQGEGAILKTLPPVSKGYEEILLSVIHIALKLRNNILNHPSPQTGFIVIANDALASIPSSVYMFLRVLLGEQSTWDEETKRNFYKCPQHGAVSCLWCSCS